jgi:hypothetical protein
MHASSLPTCHNVADGACPVTVQHPDRHHARLLSHTHRATSSCKRGRHHTPAMWGSVSPLKDLNLNRTCMLLKHMCLPTLAVYLGVAQLSFQTFTVTTGCWELRQLSTLAHSDALLPASCSFTECAPVDATCVP